MKETRYFGTDGIRGEVGQYPIVPEFVRRLGWAAGTQLVQAGERLVVLGHDGRASHATLSEAMMQGLHAAGVQVYDCGLCPTPAIAYLTRHHRAQAGIVISASHNPAKDNGIKFFNADGGKLTVQQEMDIEQALEAAPELSGDAAVGDVQQIQHAIDPYSAFCLASAGSLDLTGLTIVTDTANGAMSDVAPFVLDELGANVLSLFATPNGNNINAGCGATALAACQAAVLAEKADLGIAFDGDGDRVMMIDSLGQVVDGDAMLYVIATSAKKAGTLTGGVVGTVMSNMGLEDALASLDIPMARANVGDAYVLAMCRERGWLFGGEPSGHVICLNKTTTGDGLIAAIQVLSGMQSSMPSSMQVLQARLNGFQYYPQELINVRVVGPQALASSAAVAALVAEGESRLAGKGRILVRASGTEPLIRVMVEGKQAKLNVEVAQFLSAGIEKLDGE